jgi:hypothetical protein
MMSCLEEYLWSHSTENRNINLTFSSKYEIMLLRFKYLTIFEYKKLGLLYALVIYV